MVGGDTDDAAWNGYNLESFRTSALRRLLDRMVFVGCLFAPIIIASVERVLGEGLSPLEAAFIRRAAWFRAWRDHGVPIQGVWGWHSTPGGQPSLDIECLVCPRRAFGCLASARYGQYTEAQLRKAERAVIRGWVTRLIDPCPHLSPLLRKVPAEVTAGAWLAVLEGGLW